MKSSAAEEESVDLFDYALIRNVIGFVFRGVRRHLALAMAVFVSVAALGTVATALTPKTFHAESRLLANHAEVVRALGNPRSALPSEDPTRAAREIIFSRDNLETLIKQTNLIKTWDESRPTILKWKDKLSAAVSGPMADDDKLDALVGTLERKLRVDTDQQTVTISVDWHDGQTAYRLVETAQQNFLETRHVTEMTAISDALSILEMHAAGVQKQVDDALAELERVREVRKKGLRPTAPGAPTGETAGQTVVVAEPAAAPMVPAVSTPSANEAELAQLKFLLQSKKRALADLEDFRARRVQELKAQLTEQSVQYADQHPIILDFKQRIRSMEQDSPQIIKVRDDVENLISEYKRKGGQDPDSLVEPKRGGVARPRGALTQAMTASELADDPLVEFARNNLRVASAKYEELMMRIDGARIEQDTARAAFKYRYSVVRPASIPKKPIKPNVGVLVGASVAVGLVLAVLIGAVLDLLRGRVVEAWQVRYQLGLRVLSEVKVP